jgi:hypothetical protein
MNTGTDTRKMAAANTTHKVDGLMRLTVSTVKINSGLLEWIVDSGGRYSILEGEV